MWDMKGTLTNTEPEFNTETNRLLKVNHHCTNDAGHQETHANQTHRNSQVELHSTNDDLHLETPVNQTQRNSQVELHSTNDDLHLETPVNQKQRNSQISCGCSRRKWCIALIGFVSLLVLVCGILIGKHMNRNPAPQSALPSEICSPTCPNKWTQYDDGCYFASFNTGDYNSSKNFCAEQGGKLLLLNSETMEVMKHLRVDNTDLWIGLRKNQEGKWQWENGTLWPGEMTEDNKDLNCAAFMEGIHPLDCSTPRHWICIKAPETLWKQEEAK